MFNQENPFNPSTHPFCYQGHDYALSVVNEEIPACRRVIGACRRYLKDLELGEYYFDRDRAERYLRVVQQFKHVKGEWKSPNITYEPWQHWVFMNIEGFINKRTKKRRFRSAYVAVPRGNGKAHCVESKVPTPEGLKKWGEIGIGSRLYASDGSICRVVGKTPITKQRVYEVRFSGGTIVRCSGEHEWITSTDCEKEGIRETVSILNTVSRGHVISRNRDGAKFFITNVVRTDEYADMFCVQVDSEDSTYLISESYIPTHNSLLASQAVLYHLALDNPKGNEISCVATKTDQARIVLDSARVMAMNAPKYLQKTGVKVLAHKIVHNKSASFARALSSDGKSLDGLNDILTVMDELHAIPKPLFDVIYSGLSKRNDSLMLMITTAGFNTDSVGHSQSKYAEKVALGEIKDDQLFVVEYTIDPEDDIYSEITWRKANPGYGVSVDPVTISAKASKAKEVPSDLANFKVKHLNIWMSEAQAFYEATKWDKCADYRVRLEDFRGKPCRIGIDLASHIDLTSLGIVFYEKGKYYIFDKSYIPEETIRITNSTIYADCAGNGHLTATRGEAINYEYIKEEILDLNKNFKVLEAFYDPWNAIEMGQSLEKKRVNAIKFQMNVANLSEPMKKLDSLMREGKIVHNGSPLLRWALSNVVAKEDHNGNVFPRKSEERLKIDPIIAILMALAGWLQDAKKESVYHERGIRSF